VPDGTTNAPDDIEVQLALGVMVKSKTLLLSPVQPAPVKKRMRMKLPELPWLNLPPAK
jgi:hypothetical protein